MVLGRMLLVCAWSLVASLAQAQGQVIKVCADPDPPPWTYWVRDVQGAKTATMTGFSVDVFTLVFDRLKLPVQFIGDVPWARCLKQVQAGSFDFAMDAYHDTERAKVFAYSQHYNTLTPQVFFGAGRPIAATTRADLKRYRGCGMLGASYAHYGLQPEELDLGVNTYQALVTKLKAGRCDYFVEELEVIAGYKGLGIDYLGDGALRHNAVVDAKAPAKHLIAGLSGRGAKLMPDINRVLDELTRSGELERVWRKHTELKPFKP